MFSNFMKFQEGRYDRVSDVVDYYLQHVMHILKAMHVRAQMDYLGAILVHPMRRQNFADILHLIFHNSSDRVIYNVLGGVLAISLQLI